MKYAGHAGIACFVSLSLASCGPHVGGIVVEQWTPLAEGSWSLDPGAENAGWCTEIVVPEETYIAALRPVAPQGTHHITLNVASTEDAGDDCAVETFGPETIYAASSGTGEVRMPSGVAMHLHRGEKLFLHLHVYNPTWDPLDGTSGVEVVRAKPETVKDEAAFVLAGPNQFTLPPKQRTTITETCTFAADQTAVALIPLMYQLGVQFTATATRGGESTVLYDAPFQFQEQTQVAIGTVAMNAGNAISIACTFDNPKYIFVSKGHDGGEICYGALLRYPSDAAVDCVEP